MNKSKERMHFHTDSSNVLLRTHFNDENVSFGRKLTMRTIHKSEKSQALAFVTILFACVIWCQSVAGELQQDGANVCASIENKVKPVEVPTTISYDVKYMGTCAGFIPCQKTKKSYRDSKRIELRNEPVTVYKCCRGFVENQRGECIAVIDNDMIANTIQDQLMAKNLTNGRMMGGNENLPVAPSSAPVVAAVSPGQDHDFPAASRLVATHLGINLLLVIVVFTLGFSLYQYRNRLRRIKDELYYVSYSVQNRSHGAPSTISGSNYSQCGGSASVIQQGDCSVYSINDDAVSGRYESASPVPSRVSSQSRGNANSLNNGNHCINNVQYEEYPEKNQSFLSATRTVLFKSTNPGRPAALINAKLENSLTTSQVKSSSNLYQHIEPSMHSPSPPPSTSTPIRPTISANRPVTQSRSQNSPGNNIQISTVFDGQIANKIKDEPSQINGVNSNDYQVPRSLSTRPLPTPQIGQISGQIDSPVEQGQNVQVYANENDNNSMIYEEIKPRQNPKNPFDYQGF